MVSAFVAHRESCSGALSQALKLLDLKSSVYEFSELKGCEIRSKTQYATLQKQSKYCTSAVRTKKEHRGKKMLSGGDEVSARSP